MSGIARNLTASAAKWTGLLGRNFLYGSKQSYSTCWNCLKLGNASTKFITPAANAQMKFNLYSTQNRESQLLKYLDDEIAAEQESMNKAKSIPSKLRGFEVNLDGAEVNLVKETPEETITINANISLSVKHDSDYASEEGDDSEDSALESLPNFQIEIQRGDTVLRLFCTYLTVDPEGDYSREDNDEPSAPQDVFQIEEISIYKGTWEETNYTVAAEILDDGVYEMLFNVLEEKGITNEFVVEMSELFTSYEHASYVGLLRDLKKFVS